MARCKLTSMSLRNIRKSKEYQCLLIDLVKASVIGKSAAEGLLGYTIPAGLLGNTTPVDDDEPGTDDTPDTPVTTRTVTVKAYGTYQPSSGGPMLNYFRDEHYNNITDGLDIEISSNDSIDDVKDKILDAYNTRCGGTNVDSSGDQVQGSLAANPATEVTFITDVSYSAEWTEMDPQPSDISAFDDTDVISVILK